MIRKDRFPFPDQVEDRFHGNDRKESGNEDEKCKENNEIAKLSSKVRNDMEAAGMTERKDGFNELNSYNYLLFSIALFLHHVHLDLSIQYFLFYF